MKFVLFTLIFPFTFLLSYASVSCLNLLFVRSQISPLGSASVGMTKRLVERIRKCTVPLNSYEGPGGDPPAYALDLSKIKPEEKNDDADSSE